MILDWITLKQGKTHRGRWLITDPCCYGRGRRSWISRLMQIKRIVVYIAALSTRLPYLDVERYMHLNGFHARRLISWVPKQRSAFVSFADLLVHCFLMTTWLHCLIIFCFMSLAELCNCVIGLCRFSSGCRLFVCRLWCECIVTKQIKMR